MHTNSDNIVITLEHVSCKCGYRYLLKDINWTVKQGEHWVVFGMNGSGKTTLLSMIAGFKQQTQGSIKVFGQKFSNENILALRQKIGWVSTSFFDKYYSRESALNIVLSGKNGTLGLDDDIILDDVRRAKQLLQHLNLGDKINRTFDTFSKGERQNILIARALINNPEILILDEPCSGLDIYNRSYLFNTLEKMSSQKKLTIIYVTHYIEEIHPLFQKMLLLKNGSVFAQEDIQKLMNDETFTTLLEYPVQLVQGNDAIYKASIKTNSILPDFLLLE